MRKTLIILIVLVSSLFVGVTVGKSESPTIHSKLSPGKFEVYSCAESGSMPLINWTAKGYMQIIQLERHGSCLLRGTWDSSIPGLYCTGIGSLGEAQYVPDKCITITTNQVRKEKFRNVFKYRYSP